MRLRILIVFALAALLTACKPGSHPAAGPSTDSAATPAQSSAAAFDYYVLNLSWSPEFCYSHPSAPECGEHKAFVLHGLWPQNNDGTCSGLDADAFLSTARSAYRSVRIPPEFASLTHQGSASPDVILGLFIQYNPAIPRASLALDCGHNYLTAVEVCLDKSMHPTACSGLRSCRANVVRIPPP